MNSVLTVSLLILAALLVVTGEARENAAPLARAAAHNDQEKPGVPGEKALALGFCNVEADTNLIDGTLWVGHDCLPFFNRCNETLKDAYLQVLADRFVKYGEIHPGSKKLKVCERFVLMADVKSEAAATYEALHALLGEFASRYPGFLTTYSYNNTVSKGYAR